MVAAWDIYAEQLMPLQYGHPLWYPESEPGQKEVQIGDVGYLQEGHFCFLFNTMHAADDPVNSVRGVPLDFEVFDPPNPMLVCLPNAVTQPHIHSKSLQSLTISASVSTRYEFTCSYGHNLTLLFSYVSASLQETRRHPRVCDTSAAKRQARF